MHSYGNRASGMHSYGNRAMLAQSRSCIRLPCLDYMRPKLDQVVNAVGLTIWSMLIGLATWTMMGGGLGGHSRQHSGFPMPLPLGALRSQTLSAPHSRHEQCAAS